MTESLEFEWVLRPDSHPGIEHYVLHFRGEARAWDDDAGEEVLVGSLTDCGTRRLLVVVV